MSERDYIYSIDAAVRSGYGVGFEDFCNVFLDYVEHQDLEMYIKIVIRNMVFKAVDCYYDHSGGSTDTKYRVLPCSRDKIAEIIRSVE